MVRPGLLCRLRKDTKASVLPIMAAVMIPLIGIIGSGLDLSRAYLTKAKLQTACDAAALATRRHMSSGVTLTSASIAEGQRFFSFNFPTGLMNSAPVTPTIAQSATDLSVVEVSATAQVPTTLMRVFGLYTMPVRAACSADQDFVNNDIMIVLDVTASMNCEAGTNCEFRETEFPTTGARVSRLERLRGAAGALYQALAGATGVRTRYGFMPYSMTVNAGASLPTGSVRDPATYHRCNGTNGFNCASYTADAAIDRTSGWTPGSMGPWTGCIEERSDIGGAAWPITIGPTVAQADIDTGGTTAATQWQPYDNTITLGGGYYANLARFCPAAARKLTTYATATDFQNQLVASLSRVGGYTNHDLGIMWGMRFLSGTGMFSAENPNFFTPAGSPAPIRVDRHIVFLTDGNMTATSANYSSFGIPSRRDRMTGCAGGGGDAAAETCLENKHVARFLSACNHARTIATVWVIALDVGSTTDISRCATSTNHFFISNGSNLSTVFTSIGRGIGKLRVVR